MELHTLEDDTVEKTKKDSNNDDLHPAIQHMTPQQKKLFELRLKRNAARKDNYQQVVEEDKRKSEPSNAENKRAKVEYDEIRSKEKQEMFEKGLDPEKEKSLNVNASEAQWKASKKHQKDKKSNKSFGWDRK
jgi:pre-mRNA-splicing factor SYF2